MGAKAEKIRIKIEKLREAKADARKRGLVARSCARVGRKDVVGQVKGVDLMGVFAASRAYTRYAVANGLFGGSYFYHPRAPGTVISHHCYRVYKPHAIPCSDDHLVPATREMLLTHERASTSVSLPI